MKAFIASFLLLSGLAHAQSLNVDIGSSALFPTPSASYAAAGLAGAWTAVPVPSVGVALVDLAGAASGVTLSSTGGFLGFEYDNPATTGGDQALLDDAQDVGGLGAATTWTFFGLANGEYDVLTYAWAPDNASFRTQVEVQGSGDPTTLVGGVWSGAHAEGTSYARHHLTLTSGTITVTATASIGFGTLNGIQLVRESPVELLCFGDGSGTACPCGNASAPAAQAGCLNSFGSGGRVRASGVASIAFDSFVLAGSGMPDSSALYFQGTSAVGAGAGSVFGDGLRCAGGAVLRIGTVFNVAGISTYPNLGDVPISIRGQVNQGDVRLYQIWYRNSAAFCNPEVFNLSNALRVTWGA